jgi:hypothetical protein
MVRAVNEVGFKPKMIGGAIAFDRRARLVLLHQVVHACELHLRNR